MAVYVAFEGTSIPERQLSAWLEALLQEEATKIRASAGCKGRGARKRTPGHPSGLGRCVVCVNLEWHPKEPLQHLRNAAATAAYIRK